MNYTVIYTKDNDGWYTTQVVELPGCISYGVDIEDAQKMTKEAILAYLESVKKHDSKNVSSLKNQYTFISNMFIDDFVHA